MKKLAQLTGKNVVGYNEIADALGSDGRHEHTGE
jgi:hypothetical protein